MASSKTATLAKFGLASVALGAVVSLTVTTLTTTTINSTTVNTQTLSGTTMNNANSTVVIDSTDLEATVAISGSNIQALQAGGVIRGRTVSGAFIYAGTGIILNDTDGSGCSAIHLKDGVVSAQVHACP